MASLHPDFEYDIFISYRQNDNKRDGWVTHFVQALKDELDATVKNPLNIYFDENPHDGLLETHQVQESLNEKLKCLIFIPIVSQTYCDTNSFAWNNEFKPFKNMAEEDVIGLHLRLKNGNYASRILPVRIHDLDEQDEALLEAQLGGPIRAIDFIYSEPGVNRPLSPGDIPERNQNGTIYRNQINKLANAIKEVGGAILNPNDPVKVKETIKVRPTKKSPILLYLLAALVIVAGLVGSLLYFKKDGEIRPLSERERSVAVMAFDDNSPSQDQEWLGNGVAESIINTLNHIEGLRVIGKRSSFSYKERNATVREIGKELKVYSVLEGSVSKVGDRLRISAQLIDTETEVQLWNHQYDLEWGEVHEIMDDVAQNIVQSIIRDFPEAKLVFNKEQNNINPKAYEFYLKGVHYHWERYIINYHEEYFKESERNFIRALELDPGYLNAIAGLADLYDTYGEYAGQGYWNKRDSLIDLGYALNSESAYLLAIKGFSMGKDDFDSAFYYMHKSYQLDPDNELILTLIQNAYAVIGLYKESNIVSRLILAEDPLNQMALINLAENLLALGHLNQGKLVLDQLLKHDPNNRRGNQIAFSYQFVYKKDFVAARKIIERFEKIYPGENDRQFALLYAAEGKKEKALSLSDQIDIYCLLGMKDEAIKKLEENQDMFEFIMGWHYLSIKNYSPIDLIRDEPDFRKYEQAAKARYEERLEKYSGVFDWAD